MVTGDYGSYCKGSMTLILFVPRATRFGSCFSAAACKSLLGNGIGGEIEGVLSCDVAADLTSTKLVVV